MKRFLSLAILVFGLNLAVPVTASAVTVPSPRLAQTPGLGGDPSAQEDCVTLGVKINSGSDNPKICGNGEQGGIIYVYLRMIIIFLSGLVGLGVVLMLVWGGVQYIMSAGNPANVAAAKSRIMNALTGLVLFILMYGILNLIIPGGIL